MAIEPVAPVLSQHLLLSVAEQLKLPLLQIARQAEYSQLSGQPGDAQVQATADAALKLLDSYALAVRMALEPSQFEQESVSVSAVLYDAGQQLDKLAKTYGVELSLHVAGRYAPVLANRQGLQAALVSLASSLIEALPALEGPRLQLQLATHRSRYGIVAGVYTDAKQFNRRSLELGRRLQPQSRQPLVGMTHASGAGLFVADSILSAMDLQLTASRHNRLYGYGTVLQANPQLSLV